LAQYFRDHRYRHVVDRAGLIAANVIDVGKVDGRNEDDGGLLVARVLAQHLCQLEAVEFRHVDVDQYDGHLVLEQTLERLARGRGLDQVRAKPPQNHFVA